MKKLLNTIELGFLGFFFVCVPSFPFRLVRVELGFSETVSETPADKNIMEEPSINELPDDLILKIFSLLPMFKENIATHLLSKRWENPWQVVPDVMFDDESYESLVTFLSSVYGSLLSKDHQVLERLHLKLSRNYLDSDISFCVNIAVNRSVRKLRIHMSGKTLKLPSCLSTCVTLKSLILHAVNINVVPPSFRLLSLKSLHLLSVNSSGDETIASLLQVCPVLEYLVVNQTKDDDVMFKVVRNLFRLGFVCHHSKVCNFYRLNSRAMNLLQSF